MPTTKKPKVVEPAKPSKKRVTFQYQAPEAQQVFVTGSFCDWKEDAYPLKRSASGVWQRIVYLEPGRYEYRFLVDGEWRNDPACEESVPNPHGSANSVRIVKA